MSDFTLATLDLAEPQLKSTDSDQPHAALNKFAPSRTNRPVYEDDDLHALAASIKAHGVLQPILVRKLPAERLQDTFENQETRKAAFEIIAGERRWRAATIAGLRQIPFMLSDADNLHALQMQLIENLHRKDLNALEEARGVLALIEEFKLTREEAADAIGKGRTHVFESLRLLSLHPMAMDALKDGRLPRSLALLVLQRPTVAMQNEFTERLLTGGNDGGTMSYRSALDLARRNYMTELGKAPFALDDPLLCPTAGSCTNCPKRTGATPELWDKQDSDICTDTTCFNEKKDAHFAQVKAEAIQKGRQIISGKTARDIMPTETGSMRGYLPLDKASQGSKAEVRQVLGQDVSANRVVLIEAPSGGYVEAVPIHAASAAVQAKTQEPTPEGKPEKAKSKSAATEPDRAALQAEYERRWRERAVDATIAGLATCEEEVVTTLPSRVALYILHKLVAETPEKQLRSIFNIPNEEDCVYSINESLESLVEQDLPSTLIAMMQMVCAQDLKAGNYYLDGLQDLAMVDLNQIRGAVQNEMKAEAAQRSGKVSRPVKTGIKTNTRVSAQDASAAIAQAMQEAEANQTTEFAPGQVVRIKVDLLGADKTLIPTRQRLATIKHKTGDRAWMLELPADPLAKPEDIVERWVLIADYTDLQIFEETEAEHV